MSIKYFIPIILGVVLFLAFSFFTSDMKYYDGAPVEKFDCFVVAALITMWIYLFMFTNRGGGNNNTGYTPSNFDPFIYSN